MTHHFHSGSNWAFHRECQEWACHLLNDLPAIVLCCLVSRVTGPSGLKFLTVTVALAANTDRWEADEWEPVAAHVLDYFEPFAIETCASVLQVDIKGSQDRYPRSVLRNLPAALPRR